MNLARIILIVVALAFAGVTVFLVRGYLQSVTPDETAQEEEMIPASEVLVAERELPAGTILNPDAFRWQPWPRQGMNENYIVRQQGQDPLQELTGAAVKRVISAGDPITRAKLVRPGESGFLAGALAPGMRAVSIPIGAVSATSGFILPGNLVDLMLTTQQIEPQPSGINKTTLVTETIMESLRILAIDQSVDDSAKAPRLGKTATVEVTPKQAEMITVAGRMGSLSLVLRSLTEPEEGPERRVPYTQGAEVSQFLSQDENARERFMVAARNLKGGTLLQDQDFKWQLLEEGAPTTGLLLRSATPLAPVRGSYLSSDVLAGQPITYDLIIQPKEQGFIVAALQPGMRAVSFPISQTSGVSGYIAPGDHVDIMMTHTASSKEDQTLNPRRFTETIFHNLRLLGLEGGVDQATGRPSVGGTATVEVTPRQAEELVLAMDMGTLTLAMRSVPSIDLPPEDGRLPYTTELSISDALVNLLVFGTRTEPELVAARQMRQGAFASLSTTPQRTIVRAAPPTAPAEPADSGARDGRPPGLSAELPAAPDAAPPLPASYGPHEIRIYRGGGLSTVLVK